MKFFTALVLLASGAAVSATQTVTQTVTVTTVRYYTLVATH